MPVLTKQQLALSNPERIHNLLIHMNPELWNDIEPELAGILNNPKKFKFDEYIRPQLSNTAKGIYIFFIEPKFPFTPGTNYLMYVGRVTLGNNFRKRFKEYVDAIGSNKPRRNIQLLTNLWPNHTWVYVYELDLPDDRISNIEDILKDNIIPPINNQFAITEAQNTRSIYN